jgi:PAS domain S-box-containing protein
MVSIINKIKQMDIRIKKPTILIGYLILTVLMVFSVPCDGRESQPLNLNDAEQSWLAQNHTVRVRVSNFPPYMVLKGTKITGLVIDYLNLIAQRTGVRFDFVPETRPWQDALQSLMNLQGPDLITSLSPMAERKPHMIFSNPYIVSPRVIFTRKDAGVISSTDDLRGRTLAVPNGTMVHKRMEVGYPDIELLLFDTDAESMRAVSMGKADAYIGNLINTSFEIIRKGFINLKVAAPTSLGDDIYTFGIRRDWPELNSIINKALGTMTREAELAIRSKWLPVSGDIVIPLRVALTPAEQAWLKAHPDIVMGYSDSFEPEVIVNPDGTYRGILVDFIDALNKRLGTRIGLRIDPIPEVLEKARTKEIDGIANIHPEYADKLGLLKTHGYFSSYPTVFTRRDVSFERPADFVGKKIAIIDKVYFSSKIIRPYEERATVLKVKDALEGLQSVYKGEADLFLGGSINSYLITKYHFIGIIPKYVFFDYPVKVGMSTRPDWPELVSILNKGIASFSQNEIDTIVAKWVQLPPQKEIIELTAKERAWLKAHPVITLGGGIFPPLEFFDETKGQPDGVGPDYAKLIGSMLGIKFKLVSGDWHDIQQMAKAKEIDGIRLIFKNKAREKYLKFTKPYTKIAHAIVTQKKTEGIYSLKDLSGKRVGTLKGIYAYYHMKNHYPGIDIITYPSWENVMRALVNGEVEAIVGTLPVASYMTNKLFITSLKVVALPAEMDRHTYLGIRPDWPELAGIINKAIAAITKTQHSAIKRKWVALFPKGKEDQISLTLEERAWLKAHPGIRIGLPEGLEPYVMADQQGNQSGILVDFKDELNRTLGTNLILKTMPSSKIFEMSKKREIDIIYAVEPYNAEQEDLLQTNVWAIGYPAVYARQELSFKAPEDMVGKTVVLRPNMAWDNKIVQPYEKSVKIVYAETPLDAMKMILNKDADIYIGLTSHKYAITKYRLFGITQAYMFPDTQVPLVMGVRSDWPELVPILNKGLANVGKEGLRAIVAKWLQKTEKESVIELTAEEKAWLSQDHPIRVRFWQHPPFFYSKDGEVVGIAVDLLNTISAYTGITFQYENRIDRFSDVLQGLKEHEGPDLVGALMPTTEREKVMLFTKPYFNSPRFIFTRDDAPFVSSIENLFGQKVAVVKDYVLHQTLVEKYPSIDPLVFDNNEKALRAVSMGEAFAFIGDLVATPAMINEFGLKNLKAACPSGLPDHHLSMGIRNDWPELRDIISKALEAIPASEKAALMNKWSTVKFDYGISPVDVLKWILVVAGVGSGIVLLFFYWNRSLTKQVQERTSDLETINISLETEIDERKRAEEILRYQATLLENVSDAVVSVDTDFKIRSWNNAAVKTYGWKADEVMGKVFGEVTSLEYLGGQREDVLSEISKVGVWRGEVKQTQKDGEQIYVQATVSAIAGDNGKTVGFVAVNRDITVAKQAELKIYEYQQRLKALASQLTIAEEGERRRIATDLHDHVGQSLALARMQMAVAKKSAGDPEQAAKLEEISETLRETVNDTRNLVFDLSSPVMHEIGLGAAISEWLEEQIENRYGIKTEFFNNIDPIYKKTLDDDVRAILFRNVRELLANVVKHAQANQVSVSMDHADNVLKIVVRDDGIGFDYSPESQTVKPKGGFGLFSIEERMTDIGGSLEIESESGKGCKAILTVPVEESKS